MKFLAAWMLVFAIGPVATSVAQEDFAQQLFPPELVMTHQQTIGLTDEQREAIKRTMQEAQASFLDYQWDLKAESSRMSELLSTHPVDEAAVLAQAERVMKLETQIKKTQLSLLIRIKNELSEPQQTQLRELRDTKPPDRR